MGQVVFDDKAKPPKPADVAEVLGRTSRLWDELVSTLAAEYDPLIEEWKFSGKAYGWSVRLGHKKRPVAYLAPHQGSFRAGVLLGKKAYEAACEAKLPAAVHELVQSATKYPEGWGIRLEVTSKKDVATVLKLARIKMAY